MIRPEPGEQGLQLSGQLVLMRPQRRHGGRDRRLRRRPGPSARHVETALRLCQIVTSLQQFGGKFAHLLGFEPRLHALHQPRFSAIGGNAILAALDVAPQFADPALQPAVSLSDRVDLGLELIGEIQFHHEICRARGQRAIFRRKRNGHHPRGADGLHGDGVLRRLDEGFARCEREFRRCDGRGARRRQPVAQPRPKALKFGGRAKRGIEFLPLGKRQPVQQALGDAAAAHDLRLNSPSRRRSRGRRAGCFAVPERRRRSTRA